MEGFSVGSELQSNLREAGEIYAIACETLSKMSQARA